MRILSLFDGISCGHLALIRAGIEVETYYASEIDKYAIQVTQKNFPETIQLGDVSKIDFTQFIGKIDMIIGGSPCQDLSIAKTNRQGLKGARSGLFYKFVEAIRTIQPKYFLLENVASMSKESKDIISQELGVEPVLINSALVSAQQRKRLYWCNWKVEQPEDKGILLKDILEKVTDSSQTLTSRYGDKGLCYDNDKAKTLTASCYKGYGNDGCTLVAEPVTENQFRNFGSKGKILTENSDKANTLTASAGTGGGNVPAVAKRIGGFYGQNTRWGIYSETGKSPTLTASMGLGGGHVPMTPVRLGQVGKGHQGERVYSVKGKSICLSGDGGGKQVLTKIDLPDGNYIIRKLTPIECERLQTLPDNYTECVSKTQRYKSIGNGWTVDVIAHIFKELKKEDKPKEKSKWIPMTQLEFDFGVAL